MPSRRTSPSYRLSRRQVAIDAVASAVGSSAVGSWTNPTMARDFDPLGAGAVLVAGALLADPALLDDGPAVHAPSSDAARPNAASCRSASRRRNFITTGCDCTMLRRNATAGRSATRGDSPTPAGEEAVGQ